MKKKTEKIEKVFIFGAGAFGQAIAFVLAKKAKKIFLLSRREKLPPLRKELQKCQNVQFLEWNRWVQEISEDQSKIKNMLLIFAVPMSELENILKQEKKEILKSLKYKVKIISLIKGIRGTKKETFLVDKVFETYFSYEYKGSFFFLSGPSFAEEIFQKCVTLVMIAGINLKKSYEISKIFQRSWFKAVATTDIKGILASGALKNILAIGSGILEGLGHYHNSKSILVTEGLKEMSLIGEKLGGQEKTFYGPAGLGDLLLTINGDLSRNKNFGKTIAKNFLEKNPVKISILYKNLNQLVEGYETTRAIFLFLKRKKLKAPIFESIYRVLYKNSSPQKEISALMVRL